MKPLITYINEKILINKDYKLPYIEELENAAKDSDRDRSIWIAYSPTYSKGKCQFYRGGFNTHEDTKGKKFFIGGPYINKNKSNMVCLMGDFIKGVNYDEKTIVAGKILGHGYMFIARNKEDLDKFNDKNFVIDVKSKCKSNEELKKYLEENL